jgi:glycosyltransferase involved in cell wall biosynthesis
MTAPLFSIVIPTYNRAEAVAGALRSCALQTCQDFEVIVVDDDKSTDDIVGTLDRFRLLPIRFVAGHRGRAAAARNTGARLARGRYVAFLDADDAFLPDKLDACRRELEATPEALIYSRTYVDRGVGRLWIKPSRGLADGESVYDYLFVDKGWVHPSTVAVSADLARSSPFREDLSFGDDLQFAVDLWRRGVRLRMIEQPLAIYEDLWRPDRLSQSPVFQPGSTPEHQSFLDWVEGQRPYMSARAYLAYRAMFRSRLVARSRPGQALQDIWTARRQRSLSGGKCLSQMVQTFAPGMYRRCSDVVARVAGLTPPAAVEQMRKTT